MKRTVKLSFAIALALAGGNAFALGLGTIQVKSGLNQPLDAEIPVLADSPAEANALTVDLASAEDFERVGLSRSRLSVPIDMAVGTNARGQTVVKLTTKDPVREPLLDFLLVANWPKGKLLREFTILLDPPVTAPVAKSAAPATVAPVAEKPAAAPQPLAEKKAPPPKPVRPEPKPPVAAAPKPAPKPAPPPAPPAEPKPAAHATAANDYGPVAAGETLSEIARATRPDEKTNIDAMMLALLKANPKAFYQDNINALRRGAILRIPSNEEVRANGTAREAAELVRAQNDSWTGKVPVAAPTLVAHTGTPAKPAGAPAPSKGEPASKSERLALVPPSAGKGSATADRAGSAGGTGKDNAAELKGELARTKEALTTREQEATELKSRVKQLEEISTKDQRLISLKDSEIADLQKKLKDLQAKASAAAAVAAAKPPETAAPKAPESSAGTKPEQKITAKDIWGDLNASEKTPAKPGAATTATTPPPASTTSTPAATTTSATSTPAPATAASSTTTAPTATPGSTPPAPTSPASPTTSAASTPAPAAETAAASTAASTAPPPPAATPTTSSTAPSSSVTPVKPTPATRVTPLDTQPAAEPFWRNQNVLLGGGAALVLIGLLALMRFMRKPKPAFATPGISDSGQIAEADDEELRLRDALQQNPANTAASLELLRHYYARGDAAKFEAAAETMHAHLPDPNAPEWDEALAMGAVLAPNHPLFSAVAGEPHVMDTAAHEEGATQQLDEEFTYPEHAHEAEAERAADLEAARTHVGTFDFEPAPVEHAPEPAPAAAHDDSFDFDLPLHTEETPPPAVVAHDVAPEPVFTQVADASAPPRNDDIYVGEDAIGTKLDLAKAYLDMGDPEGARSMLDEVMNEGNDTQKDEARKLLAEIR